MARRKRIYISREQKEEIIKGLIETNCNIKLLAEKYQVTARTLSRWRSDYYKAEEGKQPKPEGHFVEVQVGSDIKKVSVRGTRPCYLIHSSLTFQGRRSSMRLAL